ncbi:hypothetical protein KSS87_023316 [Heliosperma pusillum]|nr:hypothetical protein KSS87_023316 [Heliosperma pusillum]
MELWKNKDVKTWKQALNSYSSQINLLSINKNKPNLITLDDFYITQLPSLLHERVPTPYLTRSELHSLMQWKLTRGKFRPRLLDYVASLDEEVVKLASQKAFLSLPDDLSKAVSELTVLKGIGPATASAVLAVYAPDVAPFMSDEAMEAVLGHSKDYSLKQYLLLAVTVEHMKFMLVAYFPWADRVYSSQELSSEDEPFTASDVERALWCSAIEAKLSGSSTKQNTDVSSKKSSGRKRKKSG